MLTINKKDVSELYRLKVLSEIHVLADRIAYFEKKYNCVFKKFEKKVNEGNKEQFGEWDDYLEWKAYTKSYDYKKKEIKEIENDDFKLVG